MAKKNYYVVNKGRKTGIFTDWSETFSYVNGYPGALYKGFSTYEEAVSYYTGDIENEDGREARKSINRNTISKYSNIKPIYVNSSHHEKNIEMTLKNNQIKNVTNSILDGYKDIDELFEYMESNIFEEKRGI